MRLLLAVFLAFILAACGTPDTTPETRSLSLPEAREAFTRLLVSIPDSFTLVKMTETRPPFVGAASYVGAFEGPSDAIGRITFDGKPLNTQPTACDKVPEDLANMWRDQGFDCSITGLALLTVNPTNLLTTSMSFLTGLMPSGKSRIFLESSGN